MRKESDMAGRLNDLFASQSLAVLATVCDGQPYCSLVAFASSSDFREIYFATRRNTRKFRNIQAQSRVSLLVDTRSNRGTDFQDAVAVTVLGEVREPTNLERQERLNIFLEKVPHLREFADSEDCALLIVDVETYLVVSQFEDVKEWRIGQNPHIKSS